MSLSARTYSWRLARLSWRHNKADGTLATVAASEMSDVIEVGVDLLAPDVVDANARPGGAELLINLDEVGSEEVT